ncbi:MAG: hypothetical protein ACPHK8_05575 [Thermoplasmatota archaeon]
MWFLAALLIGAVPFAGEADAVAIGPAGANLESCELNGVPLEGVVGPSGEFWVTRDADAWQALDMRADLEAPIRLPDDGGTARLQCPGGESSLSWNRTVFGEIVRPSPGPRVEKVGESHLPPLSFVADESWLFVWPDGRAVWETVLTDVQDRVAIHMYDLRQAWVVDALLSTNASKRAALVDHAIGLEPVELQQRAWALDSLAASGFDVVEPGSSRYRYHHLKVLVADDWVVVQSENASPNGMPERGDGNRGWGGAFHSPAMADWFWDWMQTDRDAWDSTAWEPVGALPAQPLPRCCARPTPEPLHLDEPILVRPLVSPDHTLGFIWDEVANSTRIWTQQLQIGSWESNRQGWSQPDRFAALLGPDAKVHVSPHADWPGKPVAGLHNKAILMDDAVWFGSMNGNHASRAENREVSVWLTDPHAVSYFESAFLADEQDAQVPMLLVVAFVATLVRRF